MPQEPAYSAITDSASPLGLQERGSLRTLDDGQSQFIGSSSGIYFVNKVRHAFAAASASANAHLSSPGSNRDRHLHPEDCIVADDDQVRVPSGELTPGPLLAPLSAPSGLPSYGPDVSPELGHPPPPGIARDLFMAYFKTWHCFFPFLHGPSIAKDFDLLYATGTSSSSSNGSSLSLAHVIILQCMFNLASLHSSDINLPEGTRIKRPSTMLSCLVGLATKGDIVSIQALFAAQLLLVARMFLRSAVVIAGLLSRAIFLAGLHRCPYRYPALSEQESDMRKRLFWSIYVLDRFLSQALGHPLGIQDSDVDVCSLNAPELHSRLPYPRDHYSTLSAAGPDSLHTVALTNLRHDRHQLLGFQVEFSRLSGRALELFHKSIHIRSINPESVLSLKTDLDACWNSLPSDLQDFDGAESNVGAADSGQLFSAPALFNLLHDQLRLLIHRPWLSLEPTAAEFRSSLQVCIGVSRSIILSLTKQHSKGFSLFWPANLSAAWMAGIILAFACHLQQYPTEKGQKEIARSLDVLMRMSEYWPLARNCHAVLSDLSQWSQEKTSLPHGPQLPRSERHTDNQDRPTKKRRTDANGPQTQMLLDTSPGGVQRQPIDQYPGAQSQQDDPHDLLDSGRPPARSESLHHQSAQLSNTSDFDGADLEARQSQRSPTVAAEALQPAGVQSFRGTTAIGSTSTTDNVRDGNGGSWTDFSGLSTWDSGMADLLQGVTWESLLEVVNPDHLE